MTLGTQTSQLDQGVIPGCFLFVGGNENVFDRSKGVSRPCAADTVGGLRLVEPSDTVKLALAPTVQDLPVWAGSSTSHNRLQKGGSYCVWVLPSRRSSGRPLNHKDG